MMANKLNDTAHLSRAGGGQQGKQRVREQKGFFVNNNIIAKSQSICRKFIVPARCRMIEPLSFYRFNGRKILNGFGWSLLVTCPYCGREHLHGGCQDPADLISTRLSPCGHGEYFLVLGGENE